MDICRYLESHSSRNVVKYWNLSLFLKKIDSDPDLIDVWKKLAKKIHTLSIPKTLVDFETVKSIVTDCIGDRKSKLKQLFALEKDYTDDSICYGCVLFLHNLNYSIVEFDACEDKYNGSATVVSSLLSHYFGQQLAIEKDESIESFVRKVKSIQDYEFLIGFKITDKFVEYVKAQKINYERMGIPKDRYPTMKKIMDVFDATEETDILRNINQYLPKNIFCPVIYEWEFLIPLLLKNKRYDDVLQLMLQLKYPFLLEEIVVHLLREDCIRLCLLLKKNESRYFKYYTVVLLEQWFDSLVKFGENLSDFGNTNDQMEGFDKFVEDGKLRWNHYIENMIEDLQPFVDILELKFVVKYVFSKSFNQSATETIHKKIFNEVLIRLQNTLLQFENFDKIKPSDLEIPCLLTLIQKLDEQGPAEKIEEIVLELENKIEHTNTMISISLSEYYQTIMRKYCIGLSHLTKESVLSRLETFETKFEGFNSSLNDKYLSISREVFVLSSIIYLFENNDFFAQDHSFKRNLFEKLTKQVLKQVYCCPSQSFVEQYYLIPLLLLKAVSEQVFAEMKDWFDSQLLNIDSVKIILLVLQYNQKCLTKESKLILKKRIEDEWEYEKNLLPENQQHLKNNLSAIAKKILDS